MTHNQDFETWMNLYTKRLIRLAYTYVRDSGIAEDRVQDAFIKAYRSMDQLENPSSPFPWLVQIVINECRTFQRKKRNEISVAVSPERAGISTEETVMRRSESQEIRDAVLLLPEKYRTPMILFYFEELLSHEIAEILGTNSRTIRTRIARGRERLQKQLRRREQDDRGRQSTECETFL